MTSWLFVMIYKGKNKDRKVFVAEFLPHLRSSKFPRWLMSSEYKKKSWSEIFGPTFTLRFVKIASANRVTMPANCDFIYTRKGSSTTIKWNKISRRMFFSKTTPRLLHSRTVEDNLEAALVSPWRKNSNHMMLSLKKSK